MAGCQNRQIPTTLATVNTVDNNNYNTRKLCCRKDDRPVRPIHGCPENFRDSLTTPKATIPNIFRVLLI